MLNFLTYDPKIDFWLDEVVLTDTPYLCFKRLNTPANFFFLYWDVQCIDSLTSSCGFDTDIGNHYNGSTDLVMRKWDETFLMNASFIASFDFMALLIFGYFSNPVFSAYCIFCKKDIWIFKLPHPHCLTQTHPSSHSEIYLHQTLISFDVYPKLAAKIPADND